MEKKMYDYLCRFYWENGYIPSFTSISQDLDVSKSIVNYNLDKLEEKGLITRPLKHASRYRGIMLVGALHLPPVESIKTEQVLEDIETALVDYHSWLPSIV